MLFPKTSSLVILALALLRCSSDSKFFSLNDSGDKDKSDPSGDRSDGSNEDELDEDDRDNDGSDEDNDDDQNNDNDNDDQDNGGNNTGDSDNESDGSLTGPFTPASPATVKRDRSVYFNEGGGTKTDPLPSMQTPSVFTPNVKDPGGQVTAPGPKAVETLCATHANRSIHYKVLFKANENGCRYSENVRWKDGVVTKNESPKNEFYRAVRRDPQGVFLPEGALICKLSLNFKETNDLHYDDLMFLTLNDMILMSTANLNSFFQPVSSTGPSAGIYNFSWNQLVNQDFDVPEGEKRGYCLGTSGICQGIPAHDQAGQLSVALPQSAVYALSSEIAKDRYLKFTWMITGDDNPDCSHSKDVEIDVAVQYAVP